MTEDYILTVEGFAPELWSDGLAFRGGSSSARSQKTIKCPHCGRALAQVDITTTVRLFRCAADALHKCHTFKKCGVCHNTVGVSFV